MYILFGCCLQGSAEHGRNDNTIGVDSAHNVTYVAAGTPTVLHV